MKFVSKNIKTIYYDLEEIIRDMKYNFFQEDMDNGDYEQLFLDCKILMLGNKIIDIIEKQNKTEKENMFIQKITDSYMEKRNYDEDGNREYDIYSFLYDYSDIIFAEIFNKYFE